MKLLKYDRGKSGSTTIINGGGSSSGSVDIPTRGGGNDRTIWG